MNALFKGFVWKPLESEGFQTNTLKHVIFTVFADLDGFSQIPPILADFRRFSPNPSKPNETQANEKVANGTYDNFQGRGNWVVQELVFSTATRIGLNMS